MLGASWPFCGSSSIPRIHRRPSSRIGLFIWPIGGRKRPKFWQRGSVISIPARETSGLVWGFPSLCTSAPEFPSCRYGTGRVIAGRILSLPSRRMARRWVCGRGRAPIAPRVKMPCASAPRGPRSRRFNDNAAVSLLLGSRSPSEAMVDDIYGSWPVVVCLPCRWVAPGDGVQPSPPLRESGSVYTRPPCSDQLRRWPSFVGCARHRASTAVQNAPRCGVHCCIRLAPPDRSVSQAFHACTVSARRGVAIMVVAALWPLPRARSGWRCHRVITIAAPSLRFAASASAVATSTSAVVITWTVGLINCFNKQWSQSVTPATALAIPMVIMG